jgi:hypothetical protein
MAAQRGKKTKSPLDFVPKSEKGPERGAEWLDNAARKFPMRPMPLTHIMKVTEKLAHMPRDGTEPVELFKKNTWPRIRKVLFQRYKRASKYVFASGYRASVDEDDIIENFSGKKSKGVDTAVIGLSELMSLVNPQNLKRKENRARYREISKHLKVLQPVARTLALSADTGKDGKDGKK